MYEIAIAPKAEKDIDDLERNEAIRIVSAIERLKDAPRPIGKVEKLNGYPNFWRLRVGDYRVVYTVIDDLETVIVLLIRHRREAYRHLKKMDVKIVTEFIQEISERRATQR